MMWIDLDGITYLDGALAYTGEFGNGGCYLAPAVGEDGPAWALLLVNEGPTELLALWYGPGEPDYIAEYDNDDLATIIEKTAETIEW